MHAPDVQSVSNASQETSDSDGTSNVYARDPDLENEQSYVRSSKLQVMNPDMKPSGYMQFSKSPKIAKLDKSAVKDMEKLCDESW